MQKCPREDGSVRKGCLRQNIMRESVITLSDYCGSVDIAKDAK